jgi:hypothetical protein
LIVFRNIGRALDCIFDGRLVIQETLQTRLSGCFRLGGPGNAETLQSQLRRMRGHSRLPFPRRRSVAVEALSSGQAFQPPPVSDGHRCALHVGSRPATDLWPYGLGPPGRPCFGAETPRWGPSFGQRPWSVVPVTVPFSSAQRRVGYRLRRLRAQSGPLRQAPKQLGGSVLQAVPVSGCLGRGGSPQRRDALDHCFALDTYVTAVRIGIVRSAG